VHLPLEVFAFVLKSRSNSIFPLETSIPLKSKDILRDEAQVNITGEVQSSLESVRWTYTIRGSIYAFIPAHNLDESLETGFII
jgi:hypothetical protein